MIVHRCLRTDAPALLATHGRSIGEDYSARRRENPRYRFQWPRRDGQSVYEVACAALAAMTAGRCSYCDGYPIDDTGEEHIDHFRPKSRAEFYTLVCDWQNLFLICVACNKAKLDQWDEDLLRPDAAGFAVSRYFMFNASTGEIEPNPRADARNIRRAQRTIEILGLNRKGACTSRRRVWAEITRDPANLVDSAYRFLADLA